MTIVFYILPTIGVSLIILNLLFGSHEAGSIGIIGGADGPTAIFLAGKVVKMLWMPVVTFLVLLGFYIPIRKMSFKGENL